MRAEGQRDEELGDVDRRGLVDVAADVEDRGLVAGPLQLTPQPVQLGGLADAGRAGEQLGGGVEGQLDRRQQLVDRRPVRLG